MLDSGKISSLEGKSGLTFSGKTLPAPFPQRNLCWMEDTRCVHFSVVNSNRGFCFHPRNRERLFASCFLVTAIHISDLHNLSIVTSSKLCFIDCFGNSRTSDHLMSYCIYLKLTHLCNESRQTSERKHPLRWSWTQLIKFFILRLKAPGCIEETHNSNIMTSASIALFFHPLLRIVKWFPGNAFLCSQSTG